MKNKEKNEAKNKGSKNNNNNLSLWLSVISLVGVATFAVLWICNVRPQSVVSLDSFVGVATGLIGIMVTFAIGWQIVNAMEIKSKISELEEGKKQVEVLQQQIEDQTAVLRIEINHLRGIMAIEREMHFVAFQYYHLAVYEGITAHPFDKYYSFISNDLVILQELVAKMPTEVVHSGTIHKELFEGVKRNDLSIRQSKLYPIIQAQYDAIMSDFYKKVSYEE